MDYWVRVDIPTDTHMAGDPSHPRRCLCEIRDKGVANFSTFWAGRDWNRCIGIQVPDSPFCASCIERHIDRLDAFEVRVHRLPSTP